MKNSQLLLLVVLLSLCFNSYARKMSKEAWIANKNFEELKTYVSNISDSQKTELFKVSFQMTKMFDSIKTLNLEEVERKMANKKVFAYRKEEYKKILNAKQFDDFVMMEEEKLQEWKNKKKAENKN